ncbi:MAG TPA: DUF1028 domain-containing protein [Candidatus Binataceae bacterium]
MPLVHTYSIVARDPVSAQMGVAVQSHWFAVGNIVPWAEAGVGAIATQAMSDSGYGKLGLDLMRAGKNARETLRGLLAADDLREVRQVAMVDSQGAVAAHTGAFAIAEAGHQTGDGFSVQANIMLRKTVWPAMAEAYTKASGDLAERFLATLDAAQAQGGDARGMQSAAILIVEGKSSGRPWIDRIFDLRVDDHPSPLAELRRLVSVQRAYRHKVLGDDSFARGDAEAGNREYHEAERLAADNLEMRFWHAIGLVNAGRVEDSLEILRSLFANNRNWFEVLMRLPRGMFRADETAIDRIRKLAG